MNTDPTTYLDHGRVRLALHCVRAGDGPKLLILNGLGEASPTSVPSVLQGWPGSVWALDFTGHGASTVPNGGGYSPEILMADADAALAHLGPCTVLGYGLGGYIGLLVAGARPMQVRGVIIADGTGLAGGGVRTFNGRIEVPLGVERAAGTTGAPDPFALMELADDPRPPDYALSFARGALQGSGLDTPVVVSAVSRPPWLTAVAAEFGVADMALEDAVVHFAG